MLRGFESSTNAVHPTRRSRAEDPSVWDPIRSFSRIPRILWPTGVPRWPG